MLSPDPLCDHRKTEENMPLKVSYTCTIPAKTSYPRYYKTKRHLKDLQQRFGDISASLSGSDDAELPKTVGDVYFIILNKRPTTSNYILKALFPNGDIEKWVTNGDIEKGPKSSLQRVLTELQTDAIVFVPSRMSKRLISTIRKNRDVQFIIVSNDTKMKNKIVVSFQDYPNVRVSLTEDIKDTAIVALERVIFEPMKHTTETLVKLLESNERYNTHEDPKTKRTSHRTYTRTCKNRKCFARKRLSPKQGTTKKIGEKKNRALRNRRKEMSDCLCCVQKKYITRSKLQDYVVKVLKERIQKHRDSMERLLDEISGMYDRSRLPENEIPRIIESLTRNVSDKIAKELYAIDASVKSCGYRFQTLQVFVDDPCNDEIKIKVIDVLRRNNVNSYDIVPSIGSFEPLHKVGAKVHPNSDLDQYGSLGGFAKKNENNLVALMSRHVAIHSPDRRLLLRDGHNQIRVNIIPETVPPQELHDEILDISAAKIQPIDTENCDTRFKTEAGEPTTGKQSSYETRQLRSRQVHLWGGTTSPGMGIITMPRIRDRYKDNTFIIVENRQNTNETFGKKGDSGSMVCADDIDSEGVEVVSMLIGEDHDNPGKYATFRIDKGLEQLKRQTNDDFHLCLD